jgi:hypothetical protein
MSWLDLYLLEKERQNLFCCFGFCLPYDKGR